MNTSKFSLTASALLVAALSSLSMQANAGDESTYRRVVLGQSDLVSQPAAQQAQDAVKLAPGSYARYLIAVDGKSQAEAIAQARDAGEHQEVQIVKPVREAAKTSHERYQELLGVSAFRKNGA